MHFQYKNLIDEKFGWFFGVSCVENFTIFAQQNKTLWSNNLCVKS